MSLIKISAKSESGSRRKGFVPTILHFMPLPVVVIININIEQKTAKMTFVTWQFSI